MDELGFLEGCQYLIHDRETKYCQSFRDIIESGDVKTLPLPARSPNLKYCVSYCTSWVGSGLSGRVMSLFLGFLPGVFDRRMLA